jgi:hypothetical protein
MASAKKKPAAKRSVKYAAKAQNTARQTSPAAGWMGKGAADWQKGASDWAKQSAKLYQLPFAQGDMGAATQQAADTVKSATENMVKMSSDMMQQMFAQSQQSAGAQGLDPSAFFAQMQQHMPQMPQMPGLDMRQAQEKISSFARESSEQFNKASAGANRAAEEMMALVRENGETLVEVSNMAVSVSKELMAEIISYMNRQFAQNVELNKQALACRTLNDMFDLATRITKSNLDAFFSESVKISEMLFQCATDVSEPLNERVSETNERLSRAFSA